MSDERKIQIGSAIFNADQGHLADAISVLDAAGIDFFHWDVFDGHFIPDLGFPPQTIKAVRHLTRKPFTVHLAANEPAKFLKPLAEAGADLVYLPVESEPLLYEAVVKAKESGLKAGISLAVGTSVESIAAVLPFIDSIMVLGRVYGETVLRTNYLPQAIAKITLLKDIARENNYSYEIEAAGSLTIETAIMAIKAGADSMAFGKTLHNTDDPSRKLFEIKQAIMNGVLS